MQPVAVEASERVLPEHLPLGEHQLFQFPMRLDQQERGTGLEADASLDAECGLAHMDATSRTIPGAEIAQLVH